MPIGKLSRRNSGFAEDATNVELSFECERLEARRMMAGNVSVSMNGRGDLTIRGDRQDNSALITATLEGDLLIAGVDTQIKQDGVVAPFHVVAVDNPFDFSGNVKITGAGGNDFFTWDAIDVGGRFQVSLGGGNDVISINNAEIDNEIRVKGGGGADRIDLFAVTGREDASLFLNSQSTVPEDLDGISLLASQIDGRLELLGSSRDDNIVVEQTTVGGELKVKTSGSNDVVIFFQTSVAGVSQFDTGSGDDTVDLEQTTFSKATKFKLGSGNDLLNFFSEVTFSDAVTFDGNAGVDALFGIPPTFATQPFFAGLEVNPFGN